MMKSQTGEATGTFHMENFRRRSRYAAVFAVLAAALFAILILNINTGTTNIPVSRILKIVFLREGAQTEYNIIWKIRMPRLLMAAILGGALSLSLKIRLQDHIFWEFLQVPRWLSRWQ